MTKYTKIPKQISIISDNVMKRGYVRINFKDRILSYYLRKQGVVKRIYIDMKNEKFVDIDNKCDVNIRDCGYLLATDKKFMKTGISTFWKHADKECTCKTRYIFYLSELDDFFDPRTWTAIKQCKRKVNGLWKIIPHDVPITNVNFSEDEMNETMREMYSVYGVPPKVLVKIFSIEKRPIKLRRVQQIVADLKDQYKSVKRSASLKKVDWEYFED